MRQPERLGACVYTITHWNKSPISFLKLSYPLSPIPINLHPRSHPIHPDQLDSCNCQPNTFSNKGLVIRVRNSLKEKNCDFTFSKKIQFFLFPYELYVGESSWWNGRRNISAGSEKWLLRGQYIALEWWFCQDGEMDFVKEKLHKEFVILFFKNTNELVYREASNY